MSVLIVDDNPDVVSWLAAALSRMEGLEVSGTAHDPDEAARVAAVVQPKVAIADVAMPSGGGIRAIKLIKAVSGATAVLISSGAGDSNALIDPLKVDMHSFGEKT